MGITGSTQLEHKFFGFRLYKIFENGPLAESGLTILDNFIIPPEEVIQNKISFSEMIKRNLNKKINLHIYSVIKRFFYTIEVTPRNDWGDEKSGILGACVRYENWSTAHLNILRVIKVKENSVSEKILKLVPLEDYIISIRPEDKDFITLNKDSSDPMTIFQEVLQDNIANYIEVFIYNVKTGPRSVRFLLEQKNGEILGCDVAYGKLHELPIILNEDYDKNLVYKQSKENSKESYNNSNEDTSQKVDFVLEETKKILIGNLNRSKSNSSENVSKIQDNNNNIIKNDKAKEVKEIELIRESYKNEDTNMDDKIEKNVVNCDNIYLKSKDVDFSDDSKEKKNYKNDMKENENNEHIESKAYQEINSNDQSNNYGNVKEDNIDEKILKPYDDVEISDVKE